jgi:hypothetical protein
MTPHNLKTDQNSPDSQKQNADQTGTLHPELRTAMQATQQPPLQDDGATSTIELQTETGTIQGEFPASANHEETAVIAVALTAHLRDESETTASSTGPSRVDRWRLARRLDHQAGDRLRTRPEPGTAWKLAGRCQARR